MSRRLERLLWLAATAIGLAGVWFWAAGTPAPLPERGSDPARPSGIAGASDDSLGDWVLSVVVNDPFRLSREPSAVPYGSPPAVAMSAPARTPVPSLRLAGVLGPPWRAMLDGLPGREGAVVVAVGDTFAGIRVRAISPAAVSLSTPDTSWTLTMRRTWQ